MNKLQIKGSWDELRGKLKNCWDGFKKSLERVPAIPLFSTSSDFRLGAPTPILLLKFDGELPADWPYTEHGSWLGPYCVVHEPPRPLPRKDLILAGNEPY